MAERVHHCNAVGVGSEGCADRGDHTSGPTPNPIWNQRTGTERISVPVSAENSIVLTVDLKHYTSKRLFAIRDATEKHDMKRQATELFQFVTAWDIESEPGKTAPRSHKTLARLPHGLALALAIEVGNRSGVLVEPLIRESSSGKLRAQPNVQRRRMPLPLLVRLRRKSAEGFSGVYGPFNRQ